MGKLENWLFQRAELIIGIGIGCFVGWLLALHPVWLSASSRKHWWDIATAIGTIGATLAAVSVGISGWLRTRADRAASNRFLASIWVARLIRPYQVITDVYDAVDNFLECERWDSPDALENWKEYVALISSGQFELTDSDAFAMRHLPNRCADIIVIAHTAMNMAIEESRRCQDLLEGGHANRCLPNVSKTWQALRAALSRMKQADEILNPLAAFEEMQIRFPKW